MSNTEEFILYDFIPLNSKITKFTIGDRNQFSSELQEDNDDGQSPKTVVKECHYGLFLDLGGGHTHTFTL